MLYLDRLQAQPVGWADLSTPWQLHHIVHALERAQGVMLAVTAVVLPPPQASKEGLQLHILQAFDMLGPLHGQNTFQSDCEGLQGPCPSSGF